MSDPYLPSPRGRRGPAAPSPAGAAPASAGPPPAGPGDPVAGPAAGERGSNRPEYTVAEISGAVKRTMEDAFGHIRVRGEISRPRKPGSGHLYLTLKDETAVLDAVAWRGVASRLAIRPEEGMEVIATGRLTTYAGQSKYQLIIEQLELAGEGALLKLLEERKRRLAGEGLFDPAAKRAPPYLPTTIGVITSPTGAVIRDILHRLADRFPRRVLVWPVRVQGETCGREVADAVAGFNALPVAGPVPRPDVLIVARGGGSLEDLMGFNEEAVVRAVAASGIPIISAVGHETDTTLIDLAADRRAPTPTAAAEMAVPVRGELVATVEDLRARQTAALHRLIAERRERVASRAARLGDPARLLETWVQRLDDRAERLDRAARILTERQASRLGAAGDRLIHPARSLAETGRRVADLGTRLAGAGGRRVRDLSQTAQPVFARLDPAPIRRRLGDGRARLAEIDGRSVAAIRQGLRRPADRLAAVASLLDSLSHERVLERGFVLVRDADGGLVADPQTVAAGQSLDLLFSQARRVPVTVDGGPGGQGASGPPAAAPPPVKKTAAAAKPPAASKTDKSDGTPGKKSAPSVDNSGSAPPRQGDLLADL